jgi:hypothetical protein
MMKLGRCGIERRLWIGDTPHLGDELVIMEDPHLAEVLERENAFLARGG